MSKYIANQRCVYQPQKSRLETKAKDDMGKICVIYRKGGRELNYSTNKHEEWYVVNGLDHVRSVWENELELLEIDGE